MFSKKSNGYRSALPLALARISSDLRERSFLELCEKLLLLLNSLNLLKFSKK